MSNDYCFVGTGSQEFDYPSGEDNVYKSYQGSGGIPVGGFWKRLLFALRFGNINIFLSGYIQPASRIMIYRRVLDRVQQLAPFLSFDSQPYMVVADDGSLQWIVDAYTTSSQYPYSEPTRRAQLHPQLGQNHRQRVRRPGKILYQRSVRSRDPDLPAHLPGRFSSALGTAAGPPRAHPLSAGSLCHSGGQVRRLSHDRSQRLLQQGRPVARGHTTSNGNPRP